MKVQNGVIFIIFAFCLIFSPGKIYAQAVKVNWNDNSEPDLEGYKVYCGSEYGYYQYILNVELKKPVYIKGLQENTTYHFAVSAFDWWGNESEMSEDIEQTIPSDALSDELINIVLQPSEMLYQLGVYDPDTSYTLENKLSGIRIEIPAGSAKGLIPLAIGSASPSSPTYFEFYISPDGLALQKPMTVYVSFNCNGKKMGVSQYEEVTGAWVVINNVITNGNNVVFSTQKLGRFAMYPEELNPFSSQIGGDDSSSSGGGGGGGGGGCFISASSCSHVSHFIVIFVFLVSICTSRIFFLIYKHE